MQRKHERVRSWLATKRLDGILLSSPSNFAWFTGGARGYVSVGEGVGVAYVLVTAREAFLLTNNIEHRRLLEEELSGVDLRVLEWPWHEPERARRQLEHVVAPSRTVADIPALGLAAAPPDFTELRYRLLAAERERYRLLGTDAAEALQAVCFAARPGESEHEIAGRMAAACAKCDIVPLVNLAAADERIGLYRHPLPTSKRIRRTLMVVLTGWRQGLHVSLTRLVSFDEPDAELRARHRAVSAVDARLILESRPGTTLGEILRAGLAQYAAEGFADEWMRHHQGGLTGYAGREIFAIPRSAHRLQDNQALAWNPSITGTKSEDTVLATEATPEILTSADGWPLQKIELPVGKISRPSILVRSTA